MTQGSDSSDCKMPKKSVIKETIHSGHFMVSDFEAEALQDDEDLVAVPVPDEESRPSIITPTHQNIVACVDGDRTLKSKGPQKVSLLIDSSLTKLFQCMTVAYR
ncbi:hypothetical protein B566_EDAN012179 [Ephemera danica]|nr:hypothetical protein B566_EDAN012179 [Ephemera danica]